MSVSFDRPAVQADDFTISIQQRKNDATPTPSVSRPACFVADVWSRQIKAARRAVFSGIGIALDYGERFGVDRVQVKRRSFYFCYFYFWKISGQLFCLYDGIAFATVIHLHDKIDHVQAVHLTTTTEAINRIRICVHLHARFRIRVERAFHRTVSRSL
jgi:hypothetical protein